MSAAGMGAWWPYVLLLLVGFLPNEVWRVLGLVMARGLDEDSELVVLARSVATAIVAGVSAKIIMFSTGALATIPFEVRLGAALCACAAFAITRRSLIVGVATGELALLAGGYIFTR